MEQKMIKMPLLDYDFSTPKREDWLDSIDFKKHYYLPEKVWLKTRKNSNRKKLEQSINSFATDEPPLSNGQENFCPLFCFWVQQ